MKAKLGDRIVVEGAHQGDRRRIGLIVGLRHNDGTPPYMVRWIDGEHDVLVFPGSDAHIEHPDDQKG